MKQRKIEYLIELSKGATPAEIGHIVATLALKKFIRKYKLQRLFDGIIIAVAVFLFAEIASQSLPVVASAITAILLGCYTIISGGFIVQTK
jgi:hypothetical protein